MPKRLPGHHQIFNRGQDPGRDGPPSSGYRHRAPAVMHQGSHDPRRSVRSPERPLPAAPEQVGARQRPSVSLGKHTGRRRYRRTAVEPFPEAQCLPCGGCMAEEALQTQRTDPGQQPLLLVREQVKAESADLPFNAVQTLSVAQGVRRLAKRGWWRVGWEGRQGWGGAGILRTSWRNGMGFGRSRPLPAGHIMSRLRTHTS